MHHSPCTRHHALRNTRPAPDFAATRAHDTLVRMGNESLVLWLSAELAMGYFAAVFVGMVGLLQLVGARRDDLRWLPPRWRVPGGAALVVGALTFFYLPFYELIFVPGPAGLELMVLFGGATVLAIWLTRLLAALAQRSSSTHPTH